MVGVDKAAGVITGAGSPGGAPSPIGEKAFGQVGAAQVAGAATPFAGVFKSLVDQTQTLGKQAQDAVTGLLSGQGVEIHGVMIASQKANASFELALQVRNKAVSAYQQLMGMQF